MRTNDWSPELRALMAHQGGLATSEQIRESLSRRGLEAALRNRRLFRVWHGVYANRLPTRELQLRAIDLMAGTTIAICLATAAAVYGFDTEDDDTLHILDPPKHHLRRVEGLVVHRRRGAPLVRVGGRQATAPAWTAVEVARGLNRARSLATFDAALRSRTCTPGKLAEAVRRQAHRRGIVAVRDLLPLADPRAESAMESESRLLMHDGGLPPPALQHTITDRDGRCWRVDFAWPERRLAVEYDGEGYHSGPAAFRHERRRRAALQEVGWTVISLIAEDIRRDPQRTLRRIAQQLQMRVA